MSLFSIKILLALTVATTVSGLAFAEEVNLTCERDPNINYSDGGDWEDVPYFIWLSADRSEARVSSVTIGVHGFGIKELGNAYVDTVYQVERGKPDLEFRLDRNDLGVLYNRGYSSGKRVQFLGKCEISSSNPKI